MKKDKKAKINNKESKKSTESKCNPILNVKRTGKNRQYQNMPIFKAAIRLRITGFNQSRILNTLMDNGIKLREIKRISPKILEFTQSKKDSQKTFAILNKMCYDYTVVAESGVHTLLFWSIRHIGLIIGALFFSIVFATLSQMVWRIEINGNENLDDAIIAKNLRQCGVKVGTFKTKLNTDAVADVLREIEGIAEGTAEVKGTTLFINVLEEKKYNPPSDNNEVSDIVSQYDAEVTKIIVKSGNGLVKVGDKVAKGQILIKGERLNSNGEPIEQVRSIGTIYGRVAFKETFIFSKTEQKVERIEKKKVYTKLSFFRLTIGKDKADKCCERVVSESKLFFLPIKVIRTEYYKTKVVEVERDIEKYTEQLKDQALLNNVIKTGGSNIETVTTLTELDGDLMMLNIYIVAEMIIGQGY